jgi:hypothetical protein
MGELVLPKTDEPERLVEEHCLGTNIYRKARLHHVVFTPKTV